MEGDKLGEGEQFNLSEGDAKRILEEVNPGKPLDSEYIKWAEGRMKEMYQEAGEMTKVLGLPIEAKPLVLAAMYMVPNETQPGQSGAEGQQK